MSKNRLFIVVPCYNEEEVLLTTAEALQKKLDECISKNLIAKDSKILFVDDGSKDKTWEIICKLHKEDNCFGGVKLSRNRGHQNAVFAGLSVAYKYADVTITIDADLQDDIDCINKMLEDYLNGSQIVYGVRSKRDTDTFFKRFTAQSFYKLMKKMGVETVYNHADYRLMSKTAVEALLKYDESNLYLRGIIPQLGYKTSTVEYQRKERTAGESKYPLKKMLGLALDGITSFSTKPLSIALWLSVFAMFFGGVGFVTTLILKYACNISVMWPIITFVLLCTGALLFVLWIIGLYVGKTYIETKNRPKFFIEEELV